MLMPCFSPRNLLIQFQPHLTAVNIPKALCFGKIHGNLGVKKKVLLVPLHGERLGQGLTHHSWLECWIRKSRPQESQPSGIPSLLLPWFVSSPCRQTGIQVFLSSVAWTEREAALFTAHSSMQMSYWPPGKNANDNILILLGLNWHWTSLNKFSFIISDHNHSIEKKFSC